MKRLKNLLMILFAGCLMYACNSKETFHVSLSDILEQKGFVDVSTLNKEQRQGYKKVCTMLFTNLEFKDGLLKFTANKDEFISEGITESLYSKWTKEIADVNVVISKDTLLQQKFVDEFADIKAKGLEQIKNW